MFDKLLAIAYITLLCNCTPLNGYISRELNREPGQHNEQGVTVVELTSDEGFWFADFTVGVSRNLSLLVDTGSADVGLNTGNYKPSRHSINLNMIGQDTYGTTQSNGCGSGLVRYSPFKDCSLQSRSSANEQQFQENLYLDEVILGCITADNQTIGSVFASNPVGNDIPHDGIVGFAGR
jgi:pepsin A